MYENAFNKIERELRNEEGIANELDYVEQTSWVLFLKYLQDLEAERSDRAELNGDDCAPIIDGAFRWDKWATPKANGELDHKAARIGDEPHRAVWLQLNFLERFFFRSMVVGALYCQCYRLHFALP